MDFWLDPSAHREFLRQQLYSQVDEALANGDFECRLVAGTRTLPDDGSGWVRRELTGERELLLSWKNGA